MQMMECYAAAKIMFLLFQYLSPNKLKCTKPAILPLGFPLPSRHPKQSTQKVCDHYCGMNEINQ